MNSRKLFKLTARSQAMAHNAKKAYVTMALCQVSSEARVCSLCSLRQQITAMQCQGAFTASARSPVASGRRRLSSPSCSSLQQCLLVVRRSAHLYCAPPILRTWRYSASPVQMSQNSHAQLPSILSRKWWILTMPLRFTILTRIIENWFHRFRIF